MSTDLPETWISAALQALLNDQPDYQVIDDEPERRVRIALAAVVPLIEAAARDKLAASAECITPCDDDCELRPDGCHESHQPNHGTKRSHQPWACMDIRAAIAAARAAATERCARLAEATAAKWRSENQAARTETPMDADPDEQATVDAAAAVMSELEAVSELAKWTAAERYALAGVLVGVTAPLIREDCARLADQHQAIYQPPLFATLTVNGIPIPATGGGTNLIPNGYQLFADLLREHT